MLVDVSRPIYETHIVSIEKPFHISALKKSEAVKLETGRLFSKRVGFSFDIYVYVHICVCVLIAIKV